jgi:uncharacterized membrane protein YhaH (DUF805 family)
MTFTESISVCFKKYATFDGTASRSEYWWFVLFTILAQFGLGIISDGLAGLFMVATLLPTIAVCCRRLHDTDRSGWWQLLNLLPLIGWIIVIVFCAQETRPNRFSATEPAPAPDVTSEPKTEEVV